MHSVADALSARRERHTLGAAHGVRHCASSTGAAFSPRGTPSRLAYALQFDAAGGLRPVRPRRHGLVLAVLCALSARADAATLVVDTTADSGAGSLRQAITDANAAADADTVTFAIA